MKQVEKAHAKVNLMLRILGREASGYHSIETLFQKLELHDVVTVVAGDAVRDRTLHCDGPRMPSGGLGVRESNLAWKAAVAYVAASGWETGWRMSIEKHIPVGGGLGGGSADAAAVLRAMESLSPNKLGSARLLELSGILGADVPFFMTGASLALAWGRGDRLLVLPPLPVAPVSLFTFAEGVNTGDAYREVARMREERGGGVTARAYSADAFGSWAAVSAIAANDFEDIVMQMHSGVAALLPPLREAAHARGAGAGALGIGMLSGSGATCFAIGLHVAFDPTPYAHFDTVATQTTNEPSAWRRDGACRPDRIELAS